MLVEMIAREHDFPERERLREIIKDHSFKEGNFTLSSGKKSDVFFNLKPTMLDPEGINLLADQVIARIKGYNSPLKKAPLAGFHSTAKHIAAKAVSPSSETMRTI